ncbi:transglutaminase domain-containing protein [Patescibacteria group bacterium]|nr:transglutaminase domain-containing protein [Patescibacteria group bacterium]MBU1721394.1 transglutaminase domain-containing protein [Patescibacteria group bacterium]MBU1901834.1 transglutaminase domain-containing protein [Patescibacteria group bacterium]
MRFFQRGVIIILSIYLACFQTIAVFAQSPEIEDKNEDSSYMFYTDIMHEIAIVNGADASDEERTVLAQKIQQFIDQEEKKLAELQVSSKKESEYITFLKRQIEMLDSNELGLWDTLKFGIQDVFSKDEKVLGESEGIFDVDIPENPSTFSKANASEQYLGDFLLKRDKDPSDLFVYSYKNAQKYIQSNLPTLEDIAASDDVVITSDIESLALQLEYNPVNILNFIQEHIEYEPYYGAKKGADGCLAQRVCNDIDAATLTIALLRASDIPARYKTGIIQLSMEQLKSLIGVETAKGTFLAFVDTDFPIFIDESIDGTLQEMTEEQAESISSIFLEWTVAEAFFPQNRTGGNISSPFDFEYVESVDDLLGILDEEYGMEWIDLDGIFKGMNHHQVEIVPETSGFIADNFWEDYFAYQGEESPLQRMRNILLADTGKDIFDDTYHSTLGVYVSPVDVLPPTGPYNRIADGSNGGIVYTTRSHSVLESNQKARVAIRLFDKETRNIVFGQTFDAVEIDNIPMELTYVGKTDTDKAIIESYGGIHATPVHLVEIVPVLDVGGYEYIFDTSVSIGQNLILETDYILHGTSKRAHEKFSIAGNNEGIFFVFSGLEFHPVYDNEEDVNRQSKVLLGGNAIIAREYIKKELQDSDIYEKVFDVDDNIEFNRAVVTQNRLLNSIDGVPTIFDFNGLTIDSITYSNIYSRRTYQPQSEYDYGQLTTQNASYYEAEIFKNVAGLESMATVQGIQYAYAHPEEYTVHKITSDNIDVINTLELSANTKANLQTEISNGAYAIVPNKLVEHENWRGVVYITVKPGVYWKYAIGEQVQNGGWSIQFPDDKIVLVDPDGNRIDQYQYTVENGQFAFTDGNANTKDKMCRITHDDIQFAADQGLLGEYGLLCMVERLYFGDHDHTLILAMNAAKFKSVSDGYDYWKRESDIFDAIRDQRPASYINSNDISVYWGTYAYSGELYPGTLGAENKIDSIIIYSPKKEMAYNIYEKDIARKYVSKNTILGKHIPENLGFPIDDIINADETYSGTDGWYMNFTNGQLYLEKEWIDNVYVLFGKMSNFYNGIDNERNGLSGVQGIVGFPESDLKYYSSNLYKQSFEEADIEYNILTENIRVVPRSVEARRYQNKEFARKMLRKVWGGKIVNNNNDLDRSFENEIITDVEAFVEIVDYIANKDGISTDDFVKDVTVVFAGAEKINIWYAADLLNGRIESDYDVYGFSDTGFRRMYRDSQYCVDPNYDCVSNQLNHSMLGFSQAYFKNKEKADKETLRHDKNPSPLGVNSKKTGVSYEDIWLGMRIAMFGESLKNGTKTKEEMGEWILQNLALSPNISSSDYNSLRVHRDDYLITKSYRKKFRVLEYQFNGNNLFKWGYTDEMERYICPNGSDDFYYQNYDYFFVNSENVGDAKAIWDDNNKKMVLLYWGLKDEYNTNNKICGNLESLSNQYGITLNYTFLDMINEILE